jgi:hypothetical protein
MISSKHAFGLRRPVDPACLPKFASGRDTIRTDCARSRAIYGQLLGPLKRGTLPLQGCKRPRGSANLSHSAVRLKRAILDLPRFRGEMRACCEWLSEPAQRWRSDKVGMALVSDFSRFLQWNLVANEGWVADPVKAVSRAEWPGPQPGSAERVDSNRKPEARQAGNVVKRRLCPGAARRVWGSL